MNHLKNITSEYKQEKLDIRKINSIIVTGRCYRYQNSYYELLNVNILSKNSINGKWEHHVRYKSILLEDKIEFTRHNEDFYNKFEHITKQLK